MGAAQDDAHGFYDRSLGTIKNDSANGKPYQLVSASNASKGGDRTGSLDAKYDVAGNLTDLAVNRSLQHNATCLPTGSGCNQTFHYQWDEVGRLVRAQRWDIATTSNLGILPPSNAAADLSYTYDASDNRVLKTATALEGNERKQRHSVYISGGQELRGAQFDSAYADAGAPAGTSDYEISSKTEIAYLFAHGVRLGRVAVDNNTSMPTYAANAFAPAQHVLINLDDTLGSTSVVIDRATGELVESAAYLAHGATESDYRPERWAGLREDYRFTGKEEDVEVGLQYFGKRFLSPYIGRWVSADPLAVHAPGKADPNVYAYVSGELLKSIDPLGLDRDQRASSASGGASSTGANPHGGAPTASSGNAAGGGGARTRAEPPPAPETYKGNAGAEGSSAKGGLDTFYPRLPDITGPALTIAGVYVASQSGVGLMCLVGGAFAASDSGRDDLSLAHQLDATITVASGAAAAESLLKGSISSVRAPTPTRAVSTPAPTSLKVVEPPRLQLDLPTVGVNIGEGSAKGGYGSWGGRTFDPAAAGGPIRSLSTEGVRITSRGIDAVEGHLARFGPDAANEGMVLRLRDIVAGKMSPAQVDLNFYTHELRESVRYRQLGFRTGAGSNYELWNNAHSATLADYGLVEGPGVLYHPSVAP